MLFPLRPDSNDIARGGSLEAEAEVIAETIAEAKAKAIAEATAKDKIVTMGLFLFELIWPVYEVKFHDPDSNDVAVWVNLEAMGEATAAAVPRTTARALPRAVCSIVYYLQRMLLSLLLLQQLRLGHRSAIVSNCHFYVRLTLYICSMLYQNN